MRPALTREDKERLLKLIVTAGLEEDFTQWLEKRGYNYIFGRLDNIPDELVLEYVREKRLLADDAEEVKIYYEIGDVEPPERKRYIPAKKTPREIGF